MKFSFSTVTLLALSALATTTTVVDATSLGAGGCTGGSAAAVGHGGESSGTPQDAGFTLTADATENAGEYTVTLSGGPEFKGFLFRAAEGSDIVDAGIGQPASACEFANAVGVTHVSPDFKTEATATFTAPEGATEAVVDVTVVVTQAQDYYYTGLTVQLAAAEAEDEPADEPAEPAPLDPEPTDAPMNDGETEMMETTDAPADTEDDADAPAPDATEAPSAAWKSAQVVGLVGAVASVLALV